VSNAIKQAKDLVNHVKDPKKATEQLTICAGLVESYLGKGDPRAKGLRKLCKS